MESRNIVVRILAGFVWLVVLYVLTNTIIGMVVGGIAGASTETYEAGQVAGTEASLSFFQTYVVFILVGQLVLFSVLAYMGKLPGTTKYKSVKDS